MAPRYKPERLESRQLLTAGAADLYVDLEPAGRTDAAEMIVAADEAAVGQLSVTLGGIGGPQAVSYSDVDGTTVTITFKARSTDAAGTVVLLGDGLAATQNGKISTVAGTVTRADSISINALSGSNDTLAVAAKGGDGRVVLSKIDVDGSLRSIGAPAVDLQTVAGSEGQLDVRARLSRLELGSVNGLGLRFNQSNLIEGNAVAKLPVVKINGDAKLHNMTSGVGIASLTVAGAWTEYEPPDNSPIPSFAFPMDVDAPQIGQLSVAGVFSPNLSLDASGVALSRAVIGGSVVGDWSVAGGVGKVQLGSTTPAFSATFAEDVASLSVAGELRGDIVARSIRTMVVKGNYQDATLTLTQPIGSGAVALGRLTVGGAMNGVVIRSDALIGAITTGKLVDTAVLAGIDPSVGTGLPDEVEDFTTSASIARVTVTTSDAGAFSRSTICARDLGKLRLGNGPIDIANDTNFGLAADRIASASFVDGSGKSVTIKKLDDPDDGLARIGALGLNLGLFEIRLRFFGVGI